MSKRAWLSHAGGFTLIAITATLSLSLLGRASKDLPILFMSVAFIPILLWLIPPVSKLLAKASFAVHRILSRNSGFYASVPGAESVRFSKTLLMSFGPLSIGLLVIAQLLYLGSSWDLRGFRLGLIAVPGILVVAGLLTSLPPGAWLLESLNLRHVNPSQGTVVPVSDLFQRYLGPLGTVSGLGSFLILLHTVGYSFATALIVLAIWIAQLLPPVLAATIVYRLIVEPRVLPSLQAWCRKIGIRSLQSIEQAMPLRTGIVPTLYQQQLP